MTPEEKPSRAERAAEAYFEERDGCNPSIQECFLAGEEWKTAQVAEAAEKIGKLREYADARCLLDFDREVEEVLALLKKEGTK